MGNEHDARAGRDVAVVGHVDQQILEGLLLDPTVVDRNQLEDVDSPRVREELDTELVQVHEIYAVSAAGSACPKLIAAGAFFASRRW